MAYNYDVKKYTIPLTNYTSGSFQTYNLRLIVLRGGSRPSYGEDGYGNGTSHTIAEIFEYLRTWGVDPNDLTPCSNDYRSVGSGYRAGNIIQAIYTEIGHTGAISQCKTNILDEWQPEIPNWEVGRYTINKSPYIGNAESGTGNFFILSVVDTWTVPPTLKTVQMSYHNPFDSQAGGAISGTQLFILWLPEGYDIGQNIDGGRSYKIMPTASGASTAYIANDSGKTGIALAIYANLLVNGDLPKYEGSGEDPYSPGGTSEGGVGGHGNFDMSSDTIGVPALPTLSAVDLGLVSVFKPDKTQAQALGTFLWNPDNIWDDVKKVVNDPIQTILGFSILPYTPDTGPNPVNVKLGNMSSGVSMLPVSNQYKEIDCGTLNIQEFWGSCLDYSPYTKTHLYLPYVGIVPIDIDDIMGKELHVVYHCDCLSGACIAYILSNGSQIACYEGQVSAQIPISSNDYSNLVSSAITAVGAGLTLKASGGASAPTAVPALVGAAVNALKPNIQKSGTLAGMGGIMTTQFPFLIAQRPRQCVPAEYNKMGGYPSYITATLSECTGFTKVSDVHLQVATATEEEKREIEELLKAGVLI